MSPGRPLLLAYRALGLGDLLTGLPALRAVKRAFGGRRRVLAAPSWLEPLALHAAAADQLCPARPFEPLPAELHRAAVAVNLHGRGPQSHRVILEACPEHLIAFGHPDIPESRGGSTWQAREHEVDRWCRLLEEAGIPADPADVHIAPPPVAVPAQARGATLIHPGAASPARRWLAARWAAVARHEIETGRRVILTGSQQERPMALEIARGAGLPTGAVYAGRTDVLSLTALVAAAARVVCGDTGVGHLATALGVPSVLLFGPTAPQEWGPRVGDGRHLVLWAGRTGDPHAGRPDPGLLEITVVDVVAALERLEEPEAALQAGTRR